MDTREISTKERIMKTAARMFSESGYDKVSIREIAKATGINSASIYYHFSSKDDLLKSLYRFYAAEHNSKKPNLDFLLLLTETEHPHEVLMRTEYHFNEEIREMLDQILVTATREINADNESEQFIRDTIFANITNIMKPLLHHMVELRKIKPFDIETFIKVLSYYCFSAAALNNSTFKQNVREYQAGMSFLFSVISATE